MENWHSFYNQHQDLLGKNYPGLNLQRFLLEARDITAKKRLLEDELKDAFLKGVPFGYLLGEAEFYHQTFLINENVLIPRQETEFLVDLIVTQMRGKIRRILDVGTGSGVILLSLLSHKVGTTGVGSDLSEKALEVAKTNAKNLGLDDKTQFIQTDRLRDVEGSFDLIVSNPPYIMTRSHHSLVHPKVDEFEPHVALYLSDETYDEWFENFFMQVRSHLRGYFFMEGHELEVERQAKKLEELGFSEVSVLQDLSGAPRFITASYKV